jgi:hypothetical protein
MQPSTALRTESFNLLTIFLHPFCLSSSRCHAIDQANNPIRPRIAPIPIDVAASVSVSDPDKVVVSTSVSDVVGDESSLPDSPVTEAAGTTEPPADDTYSSTVVRVDTNVEDIVSTVADSDSAVAEQPPQHLPAASVQSAPELTASIVVNSVLVPPTTTSPVDVEYASTMTVSIVVDIVLDNVTV